MALYLVLSIRLNRTRIGEALGNYLLSIYVDFRVKRKNADNGKVAAKKQKKETAEEKALRVI